MHGRIVRFAVAGLTVALGSFAAAGCGAAHRHAEVHRPPAATPPRPAPRAAHRPLTTVGPITTPLSAYGGYLAINSFDSQTGRWRLRIAHGGRIVALAIAERLLPFDVGVGPDARGRPTVVYSRCRSYPDLRSGAFLDADLSGVGCRLRAVTLPNGAEHAIGPADPHGSISSPAIWFHRLAYARRPLHSHVAHLMLYDQATGVLRELRRGLHQDGGGYINAIDLDATDVAFISWEDSREDEPGHVNELLVDPLNGGHQIHVAYGLDQGGCGDVNARAPSLEGRRLYYLDLGLTCRGPRRLISNFHEFSLTTGHARWAVPAASGLGDVASSNLAVDGDRTYWVARAVGLTDRATARVCPKHRCPLLATRVRYRRGFGPRAHGF